MYALFCSTVPCDIANCLQCTEADICRQCDDGFELSANGDSCVRAVTDTSEGEGLSVGTIVGR